ncbi:hypothetical protein, partial [Dickeya dianthicola]|uniref:hypothetical protein n=1 Tax=Dickeya dianthicola TaxID=204039 RepID=UPI001E63B238
MMVGRLDYPAAWFIVISRLFPSKITIIDIAPHTVYSRCFSLSFYIPVILQVAGVLAAFVHP